MKRRLLTLLRLSIALAGIAFVLWSLTWTDHLALPTDHALIASHVREAPAAATETQRIRARVIEQPGDSSDGRWHARLPAELGGAVVRVPTQAVGRGPGDVRHEPGVVTTLAQARWGWLAVGLVLMVAQPVLQALRWWLLMRCRGLDPGYGQSLRLTLVGLFFNFSLPGMTGGDLVKAYYAAKGSGAGSTAVMSVLLDRVTGMIGLVVLAALAGTLELMVLEEPTLWRVTGAMWLALGALLLGGHVYISRRVRRRLGAAERGLAGAPERWWRALREGWLGRVDQAAAAYRAHVPTLYRAVVLSVGAQVMQMIAVGLAGQALGMSTPMLILVAVLPLVFLVGTLPISYQGLGVMEAVAMALLLSPGAATPNQVVGMLLVARLYLIAYALVGALVVLRGDMHMFPQEEAQAMFDDTAEHEHERAEEAEAEPAKV